MPVARRPRASGDAGVTLILVGLCMVALLVTAAVVVDYGLVQQNRQADKSATDFAASAGIRALEGSDGVALPWQGVCAARDYLMANNEELADMSGTYKDADAPAKVHGSDPGYDLCSKPGVPPYSTACSADPASWAVYEGIADGGRVRVTIQSGYTFEDSGFPEDDNAIYEDDLGNPAHNGCDQLAVIIEESEGAQFGEVAGATGYDSRIRSVARIEIGITGDATPALHMLEQHDCHVLKIGGVSGATVIVEAVGENPGIIHADSLGDGANCTGGNDGNIFQVNGDPDSPRIIARQALGPVGGEAAGVISSAALGDFPNAEPSVVASQSPDEVCAARTAADCLATDPVLGIGPREGVVVGREPVDERYRLPIIGLRDIAETRFGWDEPSDTPTGWMDLECNDPIPSDPVGAGAELIWIDCDGGKFDGNDKTFPAGVREIVIDGYVSVAGTDNTLHFVSPERVLIEGSTSVPGVAIEGGAGNQLLVNDGDPTGIADCDARRADSPTARTEFVIGSGPLRSAGDDKLLKLCQTTVFMMDDSGSPGCPIPTEDGVDPYDNGCRGWIDVRGSSSVEWTAPNQNDDSIPTAEELEAFEDLAFWTETQGGGSNISRIEGNGFISLSGIFFTPNADPFRVAGGGGYDIRDAQFITRRLEVDGGGILLMSPQPQNSVQIPVFGDFALVR